jgi:hypothetical protein
VHSGKCATHPFRYWLSWQLVRAALRVSKSCLAGAPIRPLLAQWVKNRVRAADQRLGRPFGTGAILTGDRDTAKAQCALGAVLRPISWNI